MKQRALVLAILTTTACHSEVGDESVGSAQQATSTSCVATNPGDCLYQAFIMFDHDYQVQITVPAPHRDADVPVTVVFPDGAGPWPVVVWTHGGGTTPGINAKGLTWAKQIASAGFAVLKISHVDRAPGEMDDYCDNGALPIPNGTPAAITDCAMLAVANTSYDKPMDVRAVLDQLALVELEVQEVDGAFDLDVDTVVVAGHSGGAASTLSVAGATRQIGADTWDFRHGLPLAFMAFSPQGPSSDGWTDTSFDAIERPLLTMTGTGDNNKGTFWFDRMLPHDLTPAADGKVRFFIDSYQAKHGTFNFGDAGSSAYWPWLRSAAYAFLDANVRGDAVAQAYLTSGDLVGELALDPYIPSGESGVPDAWCWKRHNNGDCIGQ